MDLQLNHPHTPSELAELNDALLSAISDENDTLLENLVEQRANLVDSLLNSLDEEQKRIFAKYETQSNNRLLSAITEKRTLIANELQKANKASKAIKKYHQV